MATKATTKKATTAKTATKKATPAPKSLGSMTSADVVTSEHAKTLKAIKDSVGMIWLTMVGYIIYLEFFKG